ncbi:MAG TPA: GspE/PulE family protein [Candidatus Pacearchaeota archaeon]|nr:GspE/PulE family protein [Candidatus Pacearchaeota archaeon]
MKIDPEKFKIFALDAGIMSSEEVDAAIKKSQEENKSLEDILVQNQLVGKDQILKLKSYILGIPFVDLQKVKVLPEILEIIPEPLARAHSIVAYKKNGEELEVAMLDPQDLETIELVKKKSGLDIAPRLTDEESIRNILNQYNKSLELEFDALIKSDDKGGIQAVKEKEKKAEGEDLQKAAEELPVIKIVDTLLKHAALEKASDIHIEPMEKEVIVRYRVDGILHDAMVLPRQIASGIVARIKVLSNLKLDEHRLPQDGRFKIQGEGVKISIRVSILPVFYGEKIVMRLLPEQTKVYSLEDLGFRKEMLKIIKEGIKKPLGMVLITGPTGSGKTTTLYTLMSMLNTPKVNISTVEDPIEYQMPKINQTQVDPKIGLTFANALRSLLRQDPNILMVGEIRDNETAALATNAALTGHLVLSTLHTNSAAGALPRLLDMQIEPFLLASTLNFVLAQRLVRRISGEKEKIFLTEAGVADLQKYCNLERLKKFLTEEKLLKGDDLTKVAFYQPRKVQGGGEGYKGRLGIYEILRVTDEMKKLIHEGASTEKIEEQAKKDGMQTMVEDGIIKAAMGLTSIEEVMRVISE